MYTENTLHTIALNNRFVWQVLNGDPSAAEESFVPETLREVRACGTASTSSSSSASVITAQMVVRCTLSPVAALDSVESQYRRLGEGWESDEDESLYGMRNVIEIVPECNENNNTSSTFSASSTSCAFPFSDEPFRLVTDHLLQTVVWFNRAQAKHLHGDYASAMCCYQHALDAMLLVWNDELYSMRSSVPTIDADASPSRSMPTTPAAVSSNASVTGIWMIQTIGIPALYALGSLSYRNNEYGIAISYLEIALTHAMNSAKLPVPVPVPSSSSSVREGLPSVGGTKSSSHKRTTAASATTSLESIQWTGVILNALGVTHYQLSFTSDTHVNSSFHYLTEAIPFLTRAWGPESIALAATLNNLGRVLLLRHDPVNAIPYFERSIQHRQQQQQRQQTTFDSSRLDTAVSLYNLGHAWNQIGDTTRAVHFFDECLLQPSMQQTEFNKAVVSILMELAAFYGQQKQYAKAESFYQQSLELVESAFGERHIAVADVLQKLGSLYMDCELYPPALAVFQAHLRILRTVHVSSHPDIMRTMCIVGEIYQRQKEPTMALKYFTGAMELQKIHHGESSVVMAAALHNVAALHNQLGDEGLALQCLQQSVRLRETIQGSDHLDLVHPTADIAALLWENDLLHNSLEAYTEVWRICTIHLGRDHPDVGDALIHIGECQFKQGDTTLTIASWNESLRIQRLNKSPEIPGTLKRLGDAHQADGSHERALDYYQQALDGEISKPVADSSVVNNVLTELGHLHLAHNKVNDAMELFVRTLRTLIQRQNNSSATEANFLVVLTPPSYTSHLHGESNHAAAA